MMDRKRDRKRRRPLAYRSLQLNERRVFDSFLPAIRPIVAEPITAPKPRPIKNPTNLCKRSAFHDRPPTRSEMDRARNVWGISRIYGKYDDGPRKGSGHRRPWWTDLEWDGPRYELISKIRETPREVYTTLRHSARERERERGKRTRASLIRRDRIVGRRNLSRVFFTRNVPPPCETRYTGFFLFPSASSFFSPSSFPTNRAPIKRCLDRYPPPPALFDFPSKMVSRSDYERAANKANASLSV